mmetsp:Transcript_23799/g.42826  ORF Transcript_23799/g.42826 Transcript_23799/m.42826 type:complete len:154 (-) Transcript_23799:2192-2653(-)
MYLEINVLPLFGSLGPEEAMRIVLLKRNDPSVATIWLYAGGGSNEIGRKRLGETVDQSDHLNVSTVAQDREHLEEFIVGLRGNMDMTELCVGLQHNRSMDFINSLGIHLQDAENNSLEPVSTGSPSLRHISLMSCSIWACEHQHPGKRLAKFL